MFKCLFVGLFGLLLSGCCSLCPKRYPYIPSVTSRLDSVIVHRLHPVPLPADTARINALLECNSRGRLYMKILEVQSSENMRLRFEIDSLGYLLFDARTNPDTVFVKSDSIYIFRDVKDTEFVEVPAKLTNKEKLLLRIGKWSIWFFSVIFACALLFLFLRLRRGKTRVFY